MSPASVTASDPTCTQVAHVSDSDRFSLRVCFIKWLLLYQDQGWVGDPNSYPALEV